MPYILYSVNVFGLLPHPLSRQFLFDHDFIRHRCNLVTE
jgi:hypothetical protein